MRLLTRHRPDADELTARCVAADRLVGERVAALARASDGHLAEPDSGRAFAVFEAAEELLYLAEYEQRKARAALQRARKRRRFEPASEDGARTTGSPP